MSVREVQAKVRLESTALLQALTTGAKNSVLSLIIVIR